MRYPTACCIAQGFRGVRMVNQRDSTLFANMQLFPFVSGLETSFFHSFPPKNGRVTKHTCDYGTCAIAAEPVFVHEHWLFLFLLCSQNDIKLNKEKVRRKNAIVLRQEEELQQRDQALGNALREVQSLTQAVNASRAEAGSVAAENVDLRTKLEESKQQLQSNEQMIRWLNQQVGTLRV